MADDRSDDGFLARWSRRKTRQRQGEPLPEPPSSARDAAPPATTLPPPCARAPRQPGTEAAPGSVTGAAAPQAEAAPLPTLADVAQLTRESDFRRFVAPGVEPGVRNAAMKKLFSDPHFNVMDGLDTYIDDYNTSEPLPRVLLRQMVQARALGLLDDELEEQDAPPAGPTPIAAATPPALAANDERATAGAAGAPDTDPPAAPAAAADRAHEDPDLQLQPDDAAGRPGADHRAWPRRV